MPRMRVRRGRFCWCTVTGVDGALAARAIRASVGSWHSCHGPFRRGPCPPSSALAGVQLRHRRSQPCPHGKVPAAKPVRQ